MNCAVFVCRNELHLSIDKMIKNAKRNESNRDLKLRESKFCWTGQNENKHQ